MKQHNSGSMPYDREDEEELYREMLSVASSTECTGLIPSAPLTQPMVDSYGEIYDLPLTEDNQRGLQGTAGVSQAGDRSRRRNPKQGTRS